MPRKSISKESNGKFSLQIVGAWDGMANAPQRSVVTSVEEETGTHFWNMVESMCAPSPSIYPGKLCRHNMEQ